MKKALLFLSLIFILLACNKTENDDVPLPGSLIGSWVNRQVQDNLIIMEKGSTLTANDYGFTFSPDGAFIERKNTGWCGTPPIAYGDFTGTWTRNDSIMNISVGYWGGTANYTWEIKKLEQFQLTFVLVKEEYIPDTK